MSDFQSISGLGRELVAVARLWRRLVSQQVSILGLHDAQWPILDNLNRSGDGITQKALAERLGLEPTAVVRVLRDMEKNRLVARDRHPHDTRNRLVRLTEKGRNLALQIAEIAQTCDREILKNLDEGALRICVAQLAALRGRLETLQRARAKLPPPET